MKCKGQKSNAHCSWTCLQRKINKIIDLSAPQNHLLPHISMWDTLYSSVHLFPILRALWIHSLFRYCELRFHNPKIFSATVHTAIKSKGAMKRNIAFRKFDQFSSSICPIHLRMNIFYKIHKSLVRFSAHFWSINCREQKLGLTLQFSLSNNRLLEISEKN